MAARQWSGCWKVKRKWWAKRTWSSSPLRNPATPVPANTGAKEQTRPALRGQDRVTALWICKGHYVKSWESQHGPVCSRWPASALWRLHTVTTAQDLSLLDCTNEVCIVLFSVVVLMVQIVGQKVGALIFYPYRQHFRRMSVRSVTPDLGNIINAFISIHCRGKNSLWKLSLLIIQLRFNSQFNF